MGENNTPICYIFSGSDVWAHLSKYLYKAAVTYWPGLGSYLRTCLVKDLLSVSPIFSRIHFNKAVRMRAPASGLLFTGSQPQILKVL
jgi:hypothetical protein